MPRNQAACKKQTEKEANIPSSNNVMSKDFYSIIGVKKGIQLTAELKREMKSAYLKLAMEYHPDKNKSEYAMEKFKRIKTA